MGTMMEPSIKNGQIVRYDYLWKWQAEQGRVNAEKKRPTCLALVKHDNGTGLTHIILLAISGKPPREDQEAMEIPRLELQRAGLSTFKRGWITVSEYNYDVIERSVYFDHQQTPSGSFSRKFMQRIWQSLGAQMRTIGSRVDRTI
jgi:hypothetical protein